MGEQQPPEGDRPPEQDGDASDQPGSKAGGRVVRGGGDGDRPEVDYGPNPEAEAADAANLEYARKATEMALEKLKDQEHDPDPELLDKLGWSKEDLAEFLRSWEALQKSAKTTPEGQRELDEALRSLGLRDPANRKRAGGTTSDDQRGLLDSGSRSSPPPKYRDQFDAFRKGASRSGN
jgi:collagen type III alpha